MIIFWTTKLTRQHGYVAGTSHVIVGMSGSGTPVAPLTVGALIPKIYPVDMIRPLSGARPA